MRFFPRFAAAALFFCGGLPITAGALQIVGNVQVESPVGTVISPGTDILVGNEIRISVTLIDDSGIFGPLCTFSSGDPAACDVPGCVDGVNFTGAQYMYPNLPHEMPCTNFFPAAPVSFVSASDAAFSGTLTGETALWEWVYRAELEHPGLDFNVLADDFSLGYTRTEGTTDYCCVMRAPPSVTLYDILEHYWGGKIRIVSAFSTSVYVYVASPGTRPPGEAYIEDVIAVRTDATNLSGAPLPIANACSRNVNDDRIKITTTALQGSCSPNWFKPSSPSLPTAGVPSMGTTSLTWNYLVDGTGICGDFGASTGGSPIKNTASATACFDSAVEGSSARSATVFITAAPLSISVSMWVDPDAAGPMSAIPLTWDPVNGMSGTLYYMADEVAEARVTFTNECLTCSYEIDPKVRSSNNVDWGGGWYGEPEYKMIDSPASAFPYMMSPGESKEFTWKFERDYADAYGALCFSDPKLDIYIQERGVCSVSKTVVMDSPFHPEGDEINVSTTANFTMEAPFGAGIGSTFYVTVKATNAALRPVTISTSATQYIVLGVASGASAWISSWPAPTPSLPLTWTPDETKDFVYTLYPAASGTLYVSAGFSYGHSGLNCLIGCNRLVRTACSSPLVIRLGEQPAFTVTVFEVPPQAVSNEPFEMKIVVSNTSTSMDNLKVTSFNIPTEPPWIAFVSDPVPPIEPFEASPEIAPGESQLFTFTVDSWCNLTDNDICFGGEGLVVVTNLTSGGVGSLTDFACLRVHGKSDLRCMLETDKAEYSVGMPIKVRLSVTNVGEDSAVGFQAQVAALTSKGAEIFPVLPLPALPGTVNGSGSCSDPLGENLDFIFDFNSSAAGEVKFMSVISGMDSISGSTVYCTAYSPVVKIATNSKMVLSANATPLVTLNRPCSTCSLSSECTVTDSGCINVEVLVKNEGDVDLINVVPQIPGIISCPGFLCPLSMTWQGSAAVYTTPATPITVPGREERTLTWKYEPVQPGCIRFNISVEGTDEATSTATLFNAITNCVDIVDRMPVELKLLSAPTVVMRGQEFEVTIEVYNPGGTGVVLSGGEPALVFVSPTGASQTENFEVVLPSATTVPSGSRLTIRAKVRALSSVPVGAAQIQIPEMGTVYTAVDAETGLPVAVRNAGGALAMEILSAAYSFEGMGPNPFKPGEADSVVIRYRIPESGTVKLKVYTIAGELVRTLVDERRSMAYYEDRWDGRNDKGQLCASGIYLIRLEGPSFSTVKKLALVK